MNILDYFNIYDPMHVKAYKYLNTNFVWPEYFKQEHNNFEYTAQWRQILERKMVDAWMESLEAKKDVKNEL